ncbi:hypothetical protein OU995_25940 [Roseateles sp. SL47]|uniref:hypothetical protein n=1 Tax=Roseateles sp. SL47 TaxID=2995138 RepID=UPI00226F82AC|nr:hypothetical protein [Roseateles sp. SL47]WAC72913.1 hypothetical protein OU995_25940 [Roseateles sp. SL47]
MAELPPEWQDGRDLGNFMPAINDAHTRLGATFGPIPLNHLLTEDPDTGQIHWCKDLSLVALDLMESLTRQGLLVRRTPQRLMGGQSADSEWELQHLDWRLFVVMERVPPQRDFSPTSVRLHHALAWNQLKPSEPVRPAITTAVIANESPETLMTLPVTWLQQEQQVLPLLNQLGPAQTLEWLRPQLPLDNSVLKLLLPPLTDWGMHEVLAQVVESAPQKTARAWVLLAGGPGILRRAVLQASIATQQFWINMVRNALPTLFHFEMPSIFTQPNGRTLIGAALLAGNEGTLRALLKLFSDCCETFPDRSQRWRGFLEVPVQDAMRAGSLQTLKVFAQEMVDMADWGRLSAGQLQPLLEGPVYGSGCAGALSAGHTDGVEWFHDLIGELGRRGLLSPSQIEAMVCSKPEEGNSGAMEAIVHVHANALRAHLMQLLNHAKAERLSSYRLTEALACRSHLGATGLGTMIERHDEDTCRRVWIECVMQARVEDLIDTRSLVDLLSARPASGVPFIRRLIKSPVDEEARTNVWLDILAAFHSRQLLNQNEVMELLEARGRPRGSEALPMMVCALNTWAKPFAVESCIKLAFNAYQRGLISQAHLGPLINPPDSRDHSQAPALITAVKSGRLAEVEQYLDTLRAQAETAALPKEVLRDLLDGRTRPGHSALATAVAEKNTAMVELLLNASKDAVSRKLIDPEQWCELLWEPEGITGPVQAYTEAPSPAVYNLLRAAASHAQRHQWLEGPAGQQMWVELMALPYPHLPPPP